MELSQLCDRLQSPEIESALMVAIRLLVQQTPRPKSIKAWVVFRFAAQRDDIELARSAIRAMDDVDDLWRGWERFYDNKQGNNFADIPSSYVAGLFFAGSHIADPYDPRLQKCVLRIESKPWNDIARDFKPCK
jgi:hypothetical protein